MNEDDEAPVVASEDSNILLTSCSGQNLRNSSPSDTPATSGNVVVEAHERRNLLLEEKTAILRRKNHNIQERVVQARKRHESLESMAGAQMLMQMANATERRVKHLENIRARARVLRLIIPKMSSTSCFSDSVGTIAIPPLRPNNSSLVGGIDNKSFEPPAELHVTVEQVKKMQKLSRNYLLKKAMSNKVPLLIINKVLNKTLSFPDAVLFLRSSSALAVEKLLHHLQLPGRSSCGYSWFLYSFVLVSDCHDSVTSSDHTMHPGFNVNVKSVHGADELNSLSFHLPIILYHLATRIFFLLRKVILRKETNPFSLPRLRLARLWRLYHFFFPMYKSNHRQSLQEIAHQALDITNTQERILKNFMINTGSVASDDGCKRRGVFFERTLFSLSALKTVSCPKWANLGVSTAEFAKVLKEVSLVTSHSLLHRSLSFDPEILDEVHVQRHYLGILYSHSHFTIPPRVSVRRWRRFWLGFYEKTLPNTHLEAPGELHSGFFYGERANGGHVLSGEQIEEIFGRNTAILLFSPNFLQALEMLQVMIGDYIEFSRFCGENEEAERVFQDLVELRGSFSVKEKSTSNYLKLILLLLLQVLEICGVDGKAAKEILDRVSEEKNFDSTRFLHVYCDLEKSLMVKWAMRCQLSTKEDFVAFENLFQFCNPGELRKNLGNDFAHMRLYDFYHFLCENADDGMSKWFDALSTVISTEKGFDLKRSRPNEMAKKFFTKILMRFFCMNLQKTQHKKKEMAKVKIFTLFYDGLCGEMTHIERIFVSSSVCLMIGALETIAEKFGVTMAKIVDFRNIQKVKEEIFAVNYFNDFQKRFAVNEIEKFYNGRSEILERFHEKFLNFITEDIDLTRIFGNFRYFASDLISIRQWLLNQCHLFYGVYYPLLNWVWEDLGQPV